MVRGSVGYFRDYSAGRLSYHSRAAVMLTPKELERRAYIEGDVKLARLYADLLNQDELLGENESLEGQISDLERDLESAQNDVAYLEKEVDRLEGLLKEE